MAAGPEVTWKPDPIATNLRSVSLAVGRSRRACQPATLTPPSATFLSGSLPLFWARAGDVIATNAAAATSLRMSTSMVLDRVDSFRASPNTLAARRLPGEGGRDEA